MQPQHTALRALFLVALHHGCRIQPEQLVTVDSDDVVASVTGVMRNAGFRCRTLAGRSWRDLSTLGSAYPVMAVCKSGHWIIVAGITTGPEGVSAAIFDPSDEAEGMRLVAKSEFMRGWSGTVVLTKKSGRLAGETKKFGLLWFMPEIIRHRAYFRDVALAAVISTFIQLSTPMLFRVIIDKVIPHHSYDTLYSVVAIFLVMTLFDGLFNYVRQQLMLLAGNKIDARLASRTFQHLLSLPLPFFEHTTAGVLARHMQQTEKVRQFLTGRLFQTMLDAAALPILIVLLCTYSVELTAVVMAFALAIAAVIGILVPTFRRCLDQLYAAEGMRQAYMVETIHGIRTVKSLAMESLRQREWDTKVVRSVRSHSVVGRLGAIAAVLTNSLDKLMQLAVIALGAIAVFNGTLSLGALVAFTMLSGRVSGPLVQIVGLVNEYQETALSVKMLGTVMDHPPERDPAHPGIRPQITGELEFDEVTFRYQGSSIAALDRVSFRVEEGQVIGVVGRSGSGKTTVTRLIQGVQTNQEGSIRLSGVDIRHIDLGHLRRDVGVVLQDSFLFRGTIYENISAARQDCPLDEVVHAARLAGAEEFIERLPMSYDTMIEEGAPNLSGGQRQRVAIARALITQPRLMIFDEATSALDPDSEAIIQENLRQIARGRSMIIVSHRLASLVQADSILVLERGSAIDFAPHAVLVDRCDIYRHLWQQQTKHLSVT